MELFRWQQAHGSLLAAGADQPQQSEQLQVLWTRPGLDASLTQQFPDLVPSTYLRGTPIMIDGVLYAPDAVGLVEAFDPATGKTLWVQKPFAPTLKEAAGESTRGVDSWRSGNDRRIVSMRGQYLYELDARSGAPISSFGDGGRVSLNRQTPDNAPFFGWNGPIVVGDVIVVGGNGGGLSGEGYGDGGFDAWARPEDIRGFDVRTRPAAVAIPLSRPRPGARPRPSTSAIWPPGRRCRQMSSSASCMCRPVLRPSLTTAVIDPATTSTRIACWRSMPRPASSSGTSRWCIMTSGTTTMPRHRRSAISTSMASASLR